jgi:hypothetical protein
MAGQGRRDSLTRDNRTEADERPRQAAATAKGRAATRAAATAAA